MLFTLVQSVMSSLEAPVHYILTGAGAMGSATGLQPFLTSELFCCKRGVLIEMRCEHVLHMHDELLQHVRQIQIVNPLTS